MTRPPALLGGLTWEQLASDRRVHRLKRGKHFEGDVRALQRVAGEAARDLGCAVRVVRDDFVKKQYLWVEFADYEVSRDKPCPSCGSRELVRTHEQFGHCPRCRAHLVLAGDFTASGAAKMDIKMARKLERRSLPRLDAFSEVELVPDPERSNREQEVWYGSGLNADRETVLLQVVYPLENGSRIPHPELDDEELYLLSQWELDPYARAAKLGVLED